LVEDNNLLITHAYTGWPGSAHDARVLRNSSIYGEANNIINDDHYLIGDSVYPLRHWLVTPFRNNGQLTIQQHRFNRMVSACTQSVERSIGHLKGRMRRLRELPAHSIEDVCNIIMAGCIMHNLCILHEDDIDKYIGCAINSGSRSNRFPNIYHNAADGIALRDQLMNMMP
uniref:Nuclease HARBI1-like n=1 Tax=Saccoglossus kowalevskii TaxID=10224 RepID=A0ABM0MDV0_SACKO